MLFTSIALLGLGVGPLLAAATELPRPYSTWMLESVIARKEGVRAADGLLSEIQKVRLSRCMNRIFAIYLVSAVDVDVADGDCWCSIGILSGKLAGSNRSQQRP
jgi:hypothetical protein